MVNRSAKSYASWKDEEIAIAAQNGASDAEEFLLERYLPLVRRVANAYFLIGGDRSDLEQEGYIGLLKAIRSFSAEEQVDFRSFARLCVTRQMISAVKTANRQKHQPLNTYVSLSSARFSDDESGNTVEETVPDTGAATPEEEILLQEQYRLVEAFAAERLSPLERTVLSYHLEGKSYQQIGHLISRDAKVVDNALQRIRKKLKDMPK